MMMDLLWRGIISQCSLKIVKSVADNCLKPLQVSGGKAKCGSKCQAKSIHASQDPFCAVIHRPCWALTPGRPGIMFSACFFPFCVHEYDSIEHKLITFTEMRILQCKPLGSCLSGAATPRRSPSGGGLSRIYMTVLTKTVDDLQRKGCESQLLAHGTEMIHVSNIPFGFRVSVKHFTNCRCFFKRSLPHFPSDFTHPIKL